MEILEFDDCYKWSAIIAKSKEIVWKKPNLLLGNGFSISYAPDKFSYSALLEVASSKISALPLSKNIFEKQNSKDFEEVINKLDQTANTLEDTKRLIQNSLQQPKIPTPALPKTPDHTPQPAA